MVSVSLNLYVDGDAFPRLPIGERFAILQQLQTKLQSEIARLNLEKEKLVRQIKDFAKDITGDSAKSPPDTLDDLHHRLGTTNAQILKATEELAAAQLELERIQATKTNRGVAGGVVGMVVGGVGAGIASAAAAPVVLGVVCVGAAGGALGYGLTECGSHAAAQEQRQEKGDQRRELEAQRETMALQQQEMSALHDQYQLSEDHLKNVQAQFASQQETLDRMREEMNAMEDELQAADLDKVEDHRLKFLDQVLANLKAQRYGLLAQENKSSKRSVAIVGARGNGKSSILNALTGLEIAVSGNVETTMTTSKVFESASCEIWDVPGETADKSAFNLKTLLRVKRSHVVIITYVDDVSTTAPLLRVCNAFDCCAVIVRNKIDQVQEEHTCTRGKIVCRKCCYIKEEAYINDPNVKLHYIAANPFPRGSPQIGIKELKWTIRELGVDIEGAPMNFNEADACATNFRFDSSWMHRFRQLMRRESIQEFPEVVKSLCQGGILSEVDCEILSSKLKTQLAKLKCNTKDELLALLQLAIYCYSLETPPVYRETSMIMNDIEVRMDSKDGAVEYVIPFIKWVVDGVCSLECSPEESLTAYRVVDYKYPDEVWDHKFIPGELLCWYTIKSVTEHHAQASAWIRQFSNPTMFIIEDCRGGSISQFSEFPRERERLLLPGTMLQVLSAKRSVEEGHDSIVDDEAGRVDKIFLRMLPHLTDNQWEGLFVSGDSPQ